MIMKKGLLNLSRHGRQFCRLVMVSGFRLYCSTTCLATNLINIGFSFSTISSKEKPTERKFDKLGNDKSSAVLISNNSIITKYVQHGKLQEARQLFDKMSERDVVSWTAMITGYARNGRVEEARKTFNSMPERNVVSWNAMISGCIWNGKTEEAFLLFNKMPERNMVTWSVMIAGYAHNGDIVSARQLFDKMPERDLVSWNVMITGYIENGSVDCARQLFDKMPGRNVISWTAVIAGYCQNGRIDNAREVFDKMPERNVVSWTAMIAGYAQNNCGEEALKLFSLMQETSTKPNQNTFTAVLSACASLASHEQGKQVHTIIILMGFESDVILKNALISMYSKCGSIDDAQQVFGQMTERDVVSWNAIIAGHVQNEHGEQALKLFSQMQQAGTKPSQSTFTSVLTASASLAILEQGMQVHAHIMKTQFRLDVFVENSLVDMYAKCGSIEYAKQLFDRMPKRDVISWNSMIVGLAQHGNGKVALQLIEQMQQIGMKPNHVTFLGVLSACSHVGLVDEGWHYFDSMTRVFGITPRVDHYACMVDLLGRAGHLKEAEGFINKMPFEPHAALWGALLGACRIHANVALAKRAAEHLFELEPQNATAYVVLSNMYAVAGRWNDEERVKIMKKNRRVKKNPGCSWIIVKNRVHAFLAGDRLHPQTENIYAMLVILSGQIEEAGYVPDSRFVLCSTEE